jgi:adenylate kinase family enzyme
MIHRIHILGASGSGTTTLGRALAERLESPHFDTDDYFWLPTDPPFTHQRERTERQQRLMDDLTAHDAWVVSGSLCGWGDVAIPLFELVVFLWIPHEVHTLWNNAMEQRISLITFWRRPLYATRKAKTGNRSV